MLDSAERVVSREGAARLTLEAVALEAGISKASVIYDYKTKRALIRAMIERRVASEETRVQSLLDAAPAHADARIRAQVAATSRSMTEQEQSVALNLCAALAQDEALREPAQASLRRTVDAIGAESKHPRGAMLAFLAIEGLMLLECFGLHRFSEPERGRLIADIRWLIDQSPNPSSLD